MSNCCLKSQCFVFSDWENYYLIVFFSKFYSSFKLCFVYFQVQDFKTEEQTPGPTRSGRGARLWRERSLFFHPKQIYTEENNSMELTKQNQLLQENKRCPPLLSQADLWSWLSRPSASQVFMNELSGKGALDASFAEVAPNISCMVSNERQCCYSLQYIVQWIFVLALLAVQNPSTEFLPWLFTHKQQCFFLLFADWLPLV